AAAPSAAAPNVADNHDATRTAPAAPEVATITVTLAVDPVSATVMLDDSTVSSEHLTLPRDGALHRLRITAPGYQGYDETLRFDESQRLVVQLKKAVAPVRGKPRKDRPERPEKIESQSPYDN
ncbi:MAG TPA: hypothetical protein VIX73_36230, partial [Kofleriaceae bacterium]